MSSDDKNRKKAGGYSHSEEHSVIYTWEINQITSFFESARSSEEVVSLRSLEFSTGAEVKDSWSIKMIIDKDNELSTNKTWISLFLMPSNGNKKVRTKYFFYLLNSNNEKIVKNFQIYNQLSNLKIDYIFPHSANGYGYAQYMKIDEILEKKNEFFPNNILTVCIDLTVYDEYVRIDNTIKPLNYIKRQLSDDFEILLNTKKNCDVIIRIGDKSFDAHKLILRARSCVFDAMFSHNMKENQENEVTIPDIDPEIFKKVLEFIYTNNVEDLDNFAEELLEASDKYQLLGLKEMCERSLSKNLILENSIRILFLADLHNAKKLRELVIHYVAANFPRLKNLEEFRALEKIRPFLLLDVLKKHSGFES